MRERYDNAELKIDVGGWSTFDDLTDRVVGDMHENNKHKWETIQGYKTVVGNEYAIRRWLQDWVGYALVTPPYINRPDLEWANTNRIELCGPTTTSWKDNWSDMRSCTATPPKPSSKRTIPWEGLMPARDADGRAT